ncbi:lipopolysaccharide transport periplasmic protein LptA, partial [Escherichia coli]
MQDNGKPVEGHASQMHYELAKDFVVRTGNNHFVGINFDGALGDEQGKEVIDGYGKPATFYQMQDNGKPVEGHASQMHYELAKDFVVLTGNAYLQQVDSNIKGDKITYLVKEQKMQAFSDKGKRVTTVLVPSQLQDKNNKGQTPAQKKGN